MTDDLEIVLERRGATGLVVLNRPRALNALTLGMIRDFQPVLDAWALDREIKAVVVRGAGERAFCAGGDVRAVYEAGKVGGDLTRTFFREEYVLNRTIFRHPKPYIALIDGITMGGGVGLSIPGRHRIAGDKTLLAMPETVIGLFPDVGGSWFLPRLPGETGTWLALTGARLKAADCLYLGLATAYVPSDDMAALEAALLAADPQGTDPSRELERIVAGFARDPGPSEVAAHRAAIDRCFAADTVEEIFDALEREGDDWGRAQLAQLQKGSPTSMKVTLEQLRRGSRLDSFEDCMTMEYRLSQACMASGDFYEGIRAVLVDKDHAPRWDPARLDQVGRDRVESFFAPLGAEDLHFDR